MIEALKNDDIIKKIGGRFKLTALMQKRWLELMQGGRPLVDCDSKSELDVIAQEVIEGKITAELGEPVSLVAPDSSDDSDDS